jgi:hypothetical protein
VPFHPREEVSTTSEKLDEYGDRAAPTEAAVVAMYQALTARRLTYDTMLWQVPSLSLTAQAFLLTISLGADSSRLARLISSILASAAMGMCLQLMAKYRHLEIIDARIAEKLERDLSRSTGQWPQIHSPPSQRAKTANVAPKRFVALSSYRLWISGVLLFLVADLLIVLLALVAPQILI